MIKLYYCHWNNFKKNFINKNTNTSDWLYRGHRSSDWQLESTLYRILNGNKNKILASEHHQKLATIMKNEKIKHHSDFIKLPFPQESPFKVSFLYANEEHKKNFENLFKLMINLRHLGFPSPLVDWTKNPLIAAFFAFSETTLIPAICRINISSPQDLFGLNIYPLDIPFTEVHPRHELQKSVYTLALEHHHSDTVVEQKLRKGPAFYLKSYESFESNAEIEKYIITDFAENRVEILEELYASELSFEQLYGQTHILENTVFKDLAIRLFLLEQNTAQNTTEVS